jgi:hypothetical protein
MYIVVHTHRGILSELEYRSRREMGGEIFLYVTHRDTRQKIQKRLIIMIAKEIER